MRLAAAALALVLSASAAAAAWAQWGIILAKLVEPTDRYGHDVLGGNEFAAMEVAFVYAADVATLQRIELPADRVFEDVEARVVDLGGPIHPFKDVDVEAELRVRPGRPRRSGPFPWDKRTRQHVVVVESSVTGGAELAVYALGEDEIVRVASTPPIGRRNRWLAVAGIADFDGDGQNDIAYVETPHIGGILRLWTLRDGALVETARPIAGVSNHRIGEDFISGGVRDCGDGPELVLATADWGRLVRAWLVDDAWQIEPISRSVRPELWDRALSCEM